jgi:TorA maturation chaperone TorD
MSGAQPLEFVPTLPPEEAARANLYGLIARLFYAPPDEPLISELLQPTGADGADTSPLAIASRAMLDACRTASPATLRDEHTQLFIGTGKSEVTPYLSRYLARYSSDSPLVGLRQLLNSWGIARREGVPEYEDHIAGVCETMRFVIAVQQRPPEEQKILFDRFLYRGASAFCTAVSASKDARFYRLVANFAQAFLEIEKTAFEMLG